MVLDDTRSSVGPPDVEDRIKSLGTDLFTLPFTFQARVFAPSPASNVGLRMFIRRFPLFPTCLIVVGMVYATSLPSHSPHPLVPFALDAERDQIPCVVVVVVQDETGKTGVES